MGNSEIHGNIGSKEPSHEMEGTAFLDDIGGIQGVSLHIYPDCFVTRNDGEQGGFFTRTANF